jgi:hypothetical protein
MIKKVMTCLMLCLGLIMSAGAMTEEAEMERKVVNALADASDLLLRARLAIRVFKLDPACPIPGCEFPSCIEKIFDIKRVLHFIIRDLSEVVTPESLHALDKDGKTFLERSFYGDDWVLKAERIKFALEHGITKSEVLAVIRKAYVDESSSEDEEDRAEATVSLSDDVLLARCLAVVEKEADGDADQVRSWRELTDILKSE